MPANLSNSNPFAKPGQWFKGAVHFHTTNSDGKLPPDRAVACLKDKGYDFACFGDHWVVTEPGDPEGKLLIIPGCEIDTWSDDTPGNTHIMCVGVDGMEGNFRPAKWEEGGRPTHRELWDMARRISDYQIIGHPYWSCRSPEFIKSYQGVGAVEIYNHNHEMKEVMGNSEYTWHILLNEGFPVHATVADDAHGLEDSIGHAWLMVKAPGCTRPDIIQALQHGDFYSTRGPEIKDIRLEGEFLHVNCSPARRILIRTNQFFGKVHNAPPDSTITSGSCWIDLKEMEFMRVEIEDVNGLKAWSNPLFFSNSLMNPPSRDRLIHISSPIRKLHSD
ncbi:MAG: hypothetical protein WD708_09245 [Kiritimatiellia bacterium]